MWPYLVEVDRWRPLSEKCVLKHWENNIELTSSLRLTIHFSWYELEQPIRLIF